MVINFIQKKEI